MLCFRKSVCLFLALLVVSAPLMACALPGEELTKAEQDCCLQMGDQCDSSQMSDAHTCCNKAPQMEGSALKATGKFTPAAPEAIPHSSLCTATAIIVVALPRLAGTTHLSQSPPSAVSILRI